MITARPPAAAASPAPTQRADGTPMPQVLLVEPHFVLRRTVATVAGERGLARMHEAAGHEAATRLLATVRFDALVIDIDAQGRAWRLLDALRSSTDHGASPARMPVLALVDAADTAAGARLAGLQVTRLLVRPFKARALLKALEELAG